MIALREEVCPEGSRLLSKAVSLPAISPRMLAWFARYSRNYLRRHFHGMRLSLDGILRSSDLPLVLYTNHASWWDPLVCLVLKTHSFPNYTAFAPIDEAMLKRYRFFKHLGFFGVEQNSRRGAVAFLRMGEAILQKPMHMLAITPQGRFVDVRERPLRFKPGLGSLAARAPHSLFVPLAIEYTYWDERLPEVLVKFGKPVTVGKEYRSAEEWTAIFEERLASAQDALAIEARSRSSERFKSILHGGAGQGGIYDLWQWARARLRGEHFTPEHSAL